MNQINDNEKADDQYKPGTDSTDYQQYIVDGRRAVKKIAMNVFQDHLIENFHIRFKRNTITWPSRINTQTIVSSVT